MLDRERRVAQSRKHRAGGEQDSSKNDIRTFFLRRLLFNHVLLQIAGESLKAKNTRRGYVC